MNHTILRRMFLLDYVADERSRDHERRSTSAAAGAGIFTLFALLQYRLLIEHRVPWDLIAVIYMMGIAKIALTLWYRARN